MDKAYVGIDVSKNILDVALLVENKYKTKAYPNSQEDSIFF